MLLRSYNVPDPTDCTEYGKPSSEQVVVLCGQYAKQDPTGQSLCRYTTKMFTCFMYTMQNRYCVQNSVKTLIGDKGQKFSWQCSQYQILTKSLF